MGVAIGTTTNCLAGSLSPDPLSCDADNRTKLNSTCDTVADFRLSPATPDLIVQSPSIGGSTLAPSESYTFNVTVSNQGGTSSEATILRYYLSTDSTITVGDSEQGTDPVGSLAFSASSVETTSLSAPSTPGTYYLGACVDTVSGESNTTNNCSTGIQLTVSFTFFEWNLFLPAILNSARN
jgi:hypothetical protein